MTAGDGLTTCAVCGQHYYMQTGHVCLVIKGYPYGINLLSADALLRERNEKLTVAEANKSIIIWLRARVAQLEQAPDHLGNLLAVLHGDGGHYQAEHGDAKATNDALEKHYALIRRIDKLENTNSWTPVFDHPPNGKRVLVHMVNDYVVIASHLVPSRYFSHWKNDAGAVIPERNIIKWMYLPGDQDA